MSVDYFTALGDDPYSAAMLAAWADEGVGTETVRRMPGRMPGLYMIRTAGEGERSFYYWRSAAAAKEMFDGADGAKLAARLRDYDWIYFSGITLGVLTLDGALVLFEALRQASAAGARIVYDSNYRPRLWEDAEAAKAANEVALGWADIVLPSFDDERALYGDRTPAATAARIARRGPEEIVVKDGSGDVLVLADAATSILKGNPHPRPVDTTAAGDSFNAAYIAARAAGQSPMDAARAGANLAYRVIGVRGAIMPDEGNA